MAAGSSVGTASMLRARRRDVNVKPNRRLDRKSSRGMLYENEELRLRTININAEVERGQNDIKKLRRENEQLRREIWGLREEYDRLEGLLNQLQGAAIAENAAEGNYNPENGRSSMVENEENIQKASSCIQSQNHRNSLKVEFDGLSVVDEETDDNLTASETTEVNNNSSAIKESAPNECINVVISPFTDAPVVTRRKDGVCCRPHDLQLLRDIHGSGMWRKSFYNGDDECGSCPKPACRETHFSRNHLFPRVQCRSQTKIPQVIECPPDNSDFLFQSGNPSRIGYAYSSLANGNRLSSYTSEGSLVGNCFVPNPIYNINSPVEEMTLSECFHVHGGPDFFISGACPVDMARPQFPIGGNLEQLLQEVHDTSCAHMEMSREHQTKGSDRKDMVQERQPLVQVCHGIVPQILDSTAVTTSIASPVETTPTTSVVVATAITGIMPITAAATKTTTTTTTTTTITTMAMTPVEAGRSGGTKQMAEDNVISILPHFQTLKVGEGRSEDEARKDRFRSQLNIQLHIPENKLSGEVTPTIDKMNLEEVQPSNASHSSHLQTQNHSNTKREHEDNHNNSLAPQFAATAALRQRKLYKLPFEQGYQDFIASNPEISRTKPVVLSNSMQNLNSPLQAESADPDGATYNWRSNAYGRIQCITQQQNINPKTVEQVQTVSDILLPNCSETESKTHPQLPRHEIELPASTEECIFQQNHTAQPVDDRSCIALDNPHRQIRNNYVHMPSNSYEPPASDHRKEPGSIPPSPASSQRASSVVHLRGDHHVEDAERLRKSLYGSEGDNTRRSNSMYPHRKMSVIVGDTQQGCLSADNSHSSSLGHDSSTKLDRRRQVSSTINHKRRYGIASRPDFGIASSTSNNLTRSVSLDPTKHHFPVSPPETSILGNEPVSQERNHSVSGRPSSVIGSPNSMKVKIIQGNIGRVSTSNHNKSVPWCACWGNGCL